jgi:hypothetical protein
VSDPLVHCRFYVRSLAGPGAGLYRYQPVNLNNSDWAGTLPTLHPPLEKDLIFLFDNSDGGARGWFRVIDRAWHHAAYLSQNWPAGKDQPDVGPRLEIIVEPDEPLFADEAPNPT